MRGAGQLAPHFIKEEMLIRTPNKFLAARAILNTILKDTRKYCNYCGNTYDPKDYPCCDNAQVGSHIDHLRGVIKQNVELREMQANDFASTKDKSFRLAVSLPVGLYREWERCFKNNQGRKLLETGDDLQEVKQLKGEIKSLQKGTHIEGGGASTQEGSTSYQDALDIAKKSGRMRDAKTAMMEIFKTQGTLTE